jgi:hypothetical protein
VDIPDVYILIPRSCLEHIAADNLEVPGKIGAGEPAGVASAADNLRVVDIGVRGAFVGVKEESCRIFRRISFRAKPANRILGTDAIAAWEPPKSKSYGSICSDYI